MIETMQKRINEIKQQDRKSYYEIANEIGISESTLYNLMTRDKLFAPAEQKITAYLKNYLTKDEKLEAYRMDNEELKAKNERLKKDKIGLHSEIKQLEQENYGLNQELLGYKKGVQASEIIELKQTLQEIKNIAEETVKTTGMISAGFIIQKITETEEE